MLVKQRSVENNDHHIQKDCSLVTLKVTVIEFQEKIYLLKNTLIDWKMVKTME